MPTYNLPPWVGQPADPAAHYSQGIQIGMRLGAEQAANQMRQQQLLMEQQKMVFEQQYAQQKQALEIGEIVQKQRAAAAYQGMVSQGVNPMQALAVTGLSMGMDPDRLASIQANQEYRRAQLVATQEDRAARRAFAQQRESRIAGQGEERFQLLASRIKLAEEKADKAQAAKLADQTLAQKRERRMAQTSVERDTELKALRDALNFSEAELRNARNTPKGMMTRQSTYDANIKALEANRLDAAKAVDSKLKELRQQYGLNELEAGAPEVATPKVSTPEVPSRAGDDTMPDTSSRRVRVRAPNGKTGTIPENELEAALKAGYTEL